MSASLILAGATTYLKNRGVRRAVSTAVTAFLVGRRRWLVTCEDLTKWQGARPDVPGVELRLACRDDIPRLRRLPRWPADGPEAWMEPGRYLFLALQGDEVLAYRGLVTEVHPLVSAVLPLRADQVYESDVYTIAQHRRRGISRALNIASAPFLLTRGYREALGLQRLNAREAIFASRAKGIPHIGMITRTQVLGWVWLRFDPV
jgi:GNAT superfamily N-acetyltransferase